MTTGRTTEGRSRHRARRKRDQRLGLTMLYRAQDHGRTVWVEAEDVGEDGRSGRWAETFIEVNRGAWARLDVTATPKADGDRVVVGLQPGPTLGAVPLFAPSTRRVTAGLLVAPRFGWTRTGRVLAAVGFSAAPRLGGLPMVPGSAREVPAWVLAGPVLMRLRAVLRHLGRAFAPRDGPRRQIRGRVDWDHYARRNLPAGRWDRFPCSWRDLQDDQWLTGALRWTVTRVHQDMERVADSPAAQPLIALARELLHALGPGPSIRPDPLELERRSDLALGEVVRAALEGVAWVAEERGLGGARLLDGVPWSLGADVLWEAWVASLAEDLGHRLGGRVEAPDSTRRFLRWTGGPSSLGSLAPDVGVRMRERTLWLDAKYKFHLQHLRHRNWHDLPVATRAAHRADVHQALAYASLTDTPAVDTALVYPLPAGVSTPLVSAARVPAGRRQVRLLLVGLPFGCPSPGQRDELLDRLSVELLAA